jgi:hypothetical protein
MRNQNMLIVSIDPGIVNCGIYVCSLDTFTEKHHSQYLERLTFNDGDNYYETALKKLNEIEENTKFFSSAHYIVIETQMSVSYDNTRICQHLITYFMTAFKDKGNRPVVIEISNQAKTKLLMCPKGLTKYNYKKWNTNKAISILKDRKDESELEYINKMESSKKKDDMGDAVCQYEAWMLMLNGDANRPSMPVKRFQK